MLTASNVPVEEMDGFPAQLFQTLRRLVEQEDIDMERMATIIKKEMLKVNCYIYYGNCAIQLYL